MVGVFFVRECVCLSAYVGRDRAQRNISRPLADVAVWTRRYPPIGECGRAHNSRCLYYCTITIITATARANKGKKLDTAAVLLTDLGFGRCRIKQATCPTTDSIKTLPYDWHDDHRRTGDAYYKNSRKRNASHPTTLKLQRPVFLWGGVLK